MLEGVEIDYRGPDEKFPGAYVNVYIWKRLDMAYPPTFWDRVRWAWRIFRGRDIVPGDIVLDEIGMKQLHEACHLAQEHWPSKEDLERPRPSLEDLYNKLKE